MLNRFYSSYGNTSASDTSVYTTFHHHHAIPCTYKLEYEKSSQLQWDYLHSSCRDTCERLLYHHAAADHCSRITECPCAMVNPLWIDCNIIMVAAACMIQELLSGVRLSTRVSAKPFRCSPLQNCQHKHNSCATNQVCSLYNDAPLTIPDSILLLSCSEYVVYSTKFHERPLSCQIRCHGSGLQSLPTINGDPRIYYLFSPGYGQQE